MKIGFDAKRAFRNTTGLGNYSRQLIDLVAETESPVLYTPNTQKLSSWDTNAYKVICPKRMSSWWRSFGIYKDINKEKLDLFHGLSHEIPFSSSKINCPTVVTMHDCIFKRYPSYFKPWDRWIYNRKWAYSCKHADQIIAISQTTADDLIHYYQASANKIQVIPIFVDPCFQIRPDEEINRFIQNHKLPQEFFIFVGNHNPRKNIELLFKAYTQKKNLAPTAVIGSLGKQKIIQIQELGIQDKILTLDHYLTSEELSKLYQASIALIYPSKFEGFGMPILEAFQSGCPVITAPNSSLLEVGGDACIYVDSNDAADLSDKMKYLSEHSQDRISWIQKGKKRAQQFSPEIHQKKLLKLYREL